MENKEKNINSPEYQARVEEVATLIAEVSSKFEKSGVHAIVMAIEPELGFGTMTNTNLNCFEDFKVLFGMFCNLKTSIFMNQLEEPLRSTFLGLELIFKHYFELLENKDSKLGMLQALANGDIEGGINAIDTSKTKSYETRTIDLSKKKGDTHENK